MKKIIKKYFLVVLLAILCMPVMSASASEKLEIEQIIANMPVIEMYIRSEEELQSDDIQVWLEEEALEIDSIELYSEKNAPTDYFLLVDVSNSMPNNYCEEVKKALTEFTEAVSEVDKVILLSFGEEVTTLLTGDETYEQRKEAISKLHNKDNKTLLFEAIMQTADMADALKNNHRKVVIVISDGEDFAVGTSTSEEAKAALNVRNMPVYAMGIKDTNMDNLNQFGEFARSLGGNLSIFSASETTDVLFDIKDAISNTWVVTLKADNNCVNNQLNTVKLDVLSTGISRSKEVMLSQYEKDTEMPAIESVEKTEANQLKVTFSEKVVGADLATSWNVLYDEKSLPVITAVYTENNVITLTFEEELYTGTYVIQAPGVSDVSMEKNGVSDSFEIEIEGVEPTPKWLEFVKEWLWIICIGILGVCVIIFVFVWRKIKKNKGIVFVEGKASLANNVVERQHVVLSDEPGFPIALEILGGMSGEGNMVHTTIYKSLIVGRASFCDLSLEDSRLSRQHFALEHKEGEVYITDLQTTNGTFVNGVWIHNNHKLDNGDIIVAGSLKMKISW